MGVFVRDNSHFSLKYVKSKRNSSTILTNSAQSMIFFEILIHRRTINVAILYIFRDQNDYYVFVIKYALLMGRHTLVLHVKKFYFIVDES